MTNSESILRRAAETLDRVAGLLDEHLIAQRIDAPIDEALDEFNCPEDDGYSQLRFIDTAARFVAHVYEKALPGSRKPTASQARDEAVALLSRAYQGTHAGGYQGAILDAANTSSPGMELVLTRLAELIKNERRQMHIRWIECSYVDSADWPTKCAMAAILLEQHREYLPAELRQCSPEQWAEDVFGLIDTHLWTDSLLKRVFAGFFRREAPPS